MSEEPSHAALVWQQEALVHQIESTALWRAQRAPNLENRETQERASQMLSDLAVHVGQLEAEHGLFDALHATSGDLRAGEIVSERLWRYGFGVDIDPAAFVEALAAELTTLRETSE